MAVEADPTTGTVREFLVVLALGLTGLLLALVAAFTPWYDSATAPRRPNVLEMRAPVDRPPDREPTQDAPG
jgi:hypothetical protein